VLAYRSGVADSIEQHIMNRDKPGGQTLLGEELNRAEYAATTVRGRAAKEGWSGMTVGIAKKPGNAGGAKAVTVFTRGKPNIDYTQR